MRLHRFYSAEKIEPQAAGALTRYGGADQWRKVFRFKTGDQVILFDGSGSDFVCEIESYDDDGGAAAKILEVRTNMVVAKRETILCAALVKKDTFEWIAQKATELGVSQIVPIIAERSEKKNINIERLHKIIIEAAEQSGRATLPTLHDAVSLDETIEIFSGTPESAKQSLAWEPTAPLFRIDGETAAAPWIKDKKTITYIGPEGGWSQKELDLFKEKGIAMLSMGPQILRAETAVVSAISLVIFL
ncbi:MAG: Ribosomal small subunit methyltransferase [Candidatus Taylorbacteria bacterium]|nr:Ribosomal small subunit methyltransferase [Candidatus Taylorbacteria bacterium]